MRKQLQGRGLYPPAVGVDLQIDPQPNKFPSEYARASEEHRRRNNLMANEARILYDILEKNKTEKTLDKETVANIQKRFDEIKETINKELDEFYKNWEHEEIHWD